MSKIPSWDSYCLEMPSDSAKMQSHFGFPFFSFIHNVSTVFQIYFLATTLIDITKANDVEFHEFIIFTSFQTAYFDYWLTIIFSNLDSNDCSNTNVLLHAKTHRKGFLVDHNLECCKQYRYTCTPVSALSPKNTKIIKHKQIEGTKVTNKFIHLNFKRCLPQ